MLSGEFECNLRREEVLMPISIKHIDAIAREKARDVLYIEFCEKCSTAGHDGESGERSNYSLWDWRTSDARKEVIKWLDSRGISWMPCGEFANTSVMNCYRGQIYVDLPHDCELAEYKALKTYLELPDGAMRFAEVRFYLVTLKQAMINAQHDTPDFWDKWAENF